MPRCSGTILGALTPLRMWKLGLMAEAEQWAAGIPGEAYAVDDETALKVVDGSVEVVSEGQWRLFPS
jgi:hypothetical protein